MRTALEDFSIEAIAESGQCFRITPFEKGYRVIAFGRYLTVTRCGDTEYSFSCSEEEFYKVWHNYFDLGTDYQIYRDVVLAEDDYLKTAADFGKGIRILRQDPWEMLISFIISQRKSVPAIRTCVERLSLKFGKIIGEAEKADGGKELIHAFPEAEALANAPMDELAACGLGYRLDYVRDAAENVQRGVLDPYALGQLDTADLIEELMKIKGVGIKVASCIALFGCHRLDTLPVDVWMKRVIDTVYKGKFPEEYKAYAGVLQQYMFHYARINKVGT